MLAPFQLIIFPFVLLPFLVSRFLQCFPLSSLREICSFLKHSRVLKRILFHQIYIFVPFSLIQAKSIAAFFYKFKSSDYLDLDDAYLSKKCFDSLIKNLMEELESKRFVDISPSSFLSFEISVDSSHRLMKEIQCHFDGANFIFLDHFIVQKDVVEKADEKMAFALPSQLTDLIINERKDISPKEIENSTFLVDLSKSAYCDLIIKLHKRFLLILDGLSIFIKDASLSLKLQQYIFDDFKPKLLFALLSCILEKEIDSDPDFSSLIETLPSSIAKIFIALHSCTTSVDFLKLLIDFDVNFNLQFSSCSVEMAYRFNQESIDSMIESLENEESPPKCLHLVLSIILHRNFRTCLFHFSGKFIPAMLKALDGILEKSVLGELLYFKEQIQMKKNISLQDMKKISLK